MERNRLRRPKHSMIEVVEPQEEEEDTPCSLLRKVVS